MILFEYILSVRQMMERILMQIMKGGNNEEIYKFFIKII